MTDHSQAKPNLIHAMDDEILTRVIKFPNLIAEGRYTEVSKLAS